MDGLYLEATIVEETEKEYKVQYYGFEDQVLTGTYYKSDTKDIYQFARIV
jgi:hypothetical protein